MINSIKNFIEGLGIPSWGTIDEMKYERGVLTITYCDSYHITISRDGSFNDCISAEGDIAWGKADVEFALEILDNRDEILEMIDDDVEFFEADLRDYTDGGMYPAHIKRFGEEEEVIEEVILED